MSFLPWTTFARIVDRYSGDRRVRNLPCTEHFHALAFAQLTLRESLRDIETCLAAHPAKLYHSGQLSVRCEVSPLNIVDGLITIGSSPL